MKRSLKEHTFAESVPQFIKPTLSVKAVETREYTRKQQRRMCIHRTTLEVFRVCSAITATLGKQSALDKQTRPHIEQFVFEQKRGHPSQHVYQSK